jgi:hypothetical protein
MSGVRHWHRCGLALACLAFAATGWAARVSDVSNTPHNLSVTGPGPVRAVSESQICVFCHTPHAADNTPGAPLWNRSLSGETYTPYISSSINADDIAATPGGSSKLCLSCHDGTLAIGAVNVANGAFDVLIPLTGTAADGTMRAGAGAQTGFTRDLGVDLTNDHPISFTYDSTLALTDGELRDPAGEPHIGDRAQGVKPLVPLEAGKLECSSCHDPHIRDDALAHSIKFLRLNRLQSAPPAGGSFNASADTMCLACHDKLGITWAQSAHADVSVADEIYRDEAAALRDLPSGVRVWEAACLNCHDTHTVHGARRLLREGTDALGVPKSGGEPALEQACYQCHASPAESILLDVSLVPNIKTDFQLPRRMPITMLDQPAATEVHDPVDADGIEPPALLGKGGNLFNRHVECSDCHNPHRVLRNRLFNGIGPSPAGTHAHAPGHTNIASGVLRGGWGVEPVYGSTSFQDLPANYTVKRGDGGTGANTDVLNPYITREYQICLKCHSDFGYDDNNVHPVGNRPDLGNSGGGTTPGTNGLTQYTNQAREFQAPLTHRGELTAPGSGAGPGFGTNNHRSWHPVIDSTGRSAAGRNMSASTNMFLAPWNGADIGTQTMYCSDCHGSVTAVGTVEPSGGENGNPWGPHGSSENFILKGSWSETSGDNNSGVCFRCHSFVNYATEANEGDRAGFESGFGCNRDVFPAFDCKDTNLHALHANRIGRNLRCMWCHVTVPHGWKNKGLLANLNDRGPEAGSPSPPEFAMGSNTDAYNQEPYYRNAKLKVITFAPAGGWQETNCGSAGTTGAGNNTEIGRDWMGAVCENPP